MRIVAGEARGVRLAPVPRGTRPLSDRAREGLFSSLGDRVPDARCADLYAGTGAVGIEALSRGAASCEFVESGREATRTIRENLARTGLADRASVIRADVARHLEGGRGPFDLVFLDPPYTVAAEDLTPVLTALPGSLAPGATCALTRDVRHNRDVIPVDFRVTRRLSYGDTLVLVFREERWA